MRDFHGILGIGGDPCLDFANTLEGRGTPKETERLSDYGDLLAWARQADLIDDAAAAALGAKAAAQPEAAWLVLTRARSWREALYRTGAALAAGHSPDAADTALVNAKAFALIARTRLDPTPHGARRRWNRRPDDLNRVLWPLAWAAVDLLSGGELLRLRECGNPDCHRLFVDRSRNGLRRWCTMRGCGNRMKARRYHRRRRGEAASVT